MKLKHPTLYGKCQFYLGKACDGGFRHVISIKPYESAFKLIDVGGRWWGQFMLVTSFDVDDRLEILTLKMSPTKWFGHQLLTTVTIIKLTKSRCHHFLMEQNHVVIIFWWNVTNIGDKKAARITLRYFEILVSLWTFRILKRAEYPLKNAYPMWLLFFEFFFLEF